MKRVHWFQRAVSCTELSNWWNSSKIGSEPLFSRDEEIPLHSELLEISKNIHITNKKEHRCLLSNQKYFSDHYHLKNISTNF